jgi:hypothetical protein
MPLNLTCRHCHRHFFPPAEQTGKPAACPHCGKEARIAAEDLKTSPASKPIDMKTPATDWYVQAEDGRHYGPVTGAQLQAWYEEGRITADCQLLRIGATQWQWATELYPDLQEMHETANKTAANELTPATARPASPRPAAPRAAPTQTAAPITPLDPGDFPTAGKGLKMLGPVIRPLPPGYEEPRLHSAEALADRRKYAPYMVARVNRRPLHQMLLVVAILNFFTGTLRGGLYFFFFINSVIAVGAIGEAGDRQLMTRAVTGLVIAFVMFVLNVALVSGGVGLLQRQEWGRTATFFATFLGLLIQLTGICVTMMLGAEASGIVRSVWIVLLVVLLPSIVYDAFAAATLSVPSVVADLEE